MISEEDSMYIEDDRLFDAIYNRDTHIVVQGVGKIKLKTENEDVFGEPEPDYEDIITSMFLQLKNYARENDLDLLENSNYDMFFQMMMFYKL